MAKGTSIDARVFGDLLSLLIHDMRNPIATIGANVTFVRGVAQPNEEDIKDYEGAMADTSSALGQVMGGLGLAAVIANYLRGQIPISAADGDVVAAARQAVGRETGIEAEVITCAPVVKAKNGGGAGQLLAITLANAAQHASHEPVRIEIRRDGEEVVIEQHDQGRAIPVELREAVFVLDRQGEVKSQGLGRYSRYLGLVVARIMADTLGASIEADGTDGDAIFRLRFARLD